MTTPWARRANDQLRQTPYELVAPEHPVLHRAADRIENFGMEELDVIAHRLFLTCKVNRGVAIAAPQVGLPIQMVVVDEGNTGVVFCNPVVEAGGQRMGGLESCLSLPGKTFQVERRFRAVVAAQGVDGQPFGSDASGFKARMWQHEADHLTGLLLVGRFPEVAAAATPSAG